MIRIKNDKLELRIKELKEKLAPKTTTPKFVEALLTIMLEEIEKETISMV